MAAPGWNSLDDVTRIQNFLWWTGWCFFALVLIFEVASHIYGNRRDALLDAKAQEQYSNYQEQIRNLKSPRTLSQSQRDSLKSSLSRFAGQKFRVEVAIDNPEGMVFARSIRDTLINDCGWSNQGNVVVLQNLKLGPGIFVCPSKEDLEGTPEEKQSAGLLFHEIINAFENAGIQICTMGQRNLIADPIPKGVIAISIGPKP